MPFAKSKEVNARKLAQLSSKIYSKIIESTDDKKLQQQMVKPVIAASEWSFEDANKQGNF